MHKTKFEKTGGSCCNRKCPKYRQRIALPMKVKYVFFYCSRIDFRPFVQAAKQQAVWLSLDCINGKYLWALPTPTAFEKVDQTFIILGKIILLKHNLPKLLIKSKKPSVELTALGFKYKFTFSSLSAQLLFQS